MIENKNYEQGYQLGTAMFSCRALPQVIWNLDGLKIHVEERVSDSDGELVIWQTNDDNKIQEEISFHPYLDLSDARKLAGILMAWADYFENRNDQQQKVKEKEASHD